MLPKRHEPATEFGLVTRALINCQRRGVAAVTGFEDKP